MRIINMKKALVVDDDEDFLFQEKKALEALGYSVETAGGRMEAMAKLENYKPDLALIDLMMEEKDSGFVLAHHIKKIKPAIPVILVTAVTSETGIQFDMDSQGAHRWINADAMLVKPVRVEQLKTAIEKVMA